MRLGKSIIESTWNVVWSDVYDGAYSSVKVSNWIIIENGVLESVRHNVTWGILDSLADSVYGSIEEQD